jgi:hypothetical protein
VTATGCYGAPKASDGYDGLSSPPRWLGPFLYLLKAERGALIAPMPELPTKITLGEMRASGVRGLLVLRADCPVTIR